MIWVTWRQHRAQAFACLARSGGAGCPAVITSFADRFNRGIDMIIELPLIAIPGFLGIVVGAPLLGRELERGTWRMAWTQTVPRTRWLVTKLGLVTGGLVVFGVAVTAVMTWFHQPLDRVTSRLQPSAFNAEGLTFTASLLCSFGLAVLAGLLLRNTIGAMVAAYIAWEIPGAVVLLMTGPLRLPVPATLRIPCRAACPGKGVGSVPPVTGHLGDYVLGVTRAGGDLVVSYLPASRFWTVQFIGGGLFLAIAAAALGTAIWLLHRRTT